MADTGRCAVLDVSEVPKERPTGQSSTFIMMVLGKRFCWNCKKLPIHSIASIAMHCNSGIARECKIATDSTRRHKEHKEAVETIFLVRARSVCWSNDKTFRDFCQTFWTTRAIWHRDQSWQAGLELVDHEIHCIGGDLREHLQTIRPIDYDPYWQVATCTSTTARNGLMRGNRRTVTHGVRSFIRWGCESGQFWSWRRFVS